MTRLLVVVVAFSAVGRAETNSAPLSALMPHVEDFTQMWWADGFPTHSPSAAWLRVIQTGSYALVLDTESLHIPHFGAVAAAGGYDEHTSLDDRQWEQLPPAELALTIIVDGQTYRCTSGGTWSKYAGMAAGKSMGNCVATGHAAGLAAAISARQGIMPREVKVTELQDALRKDGVDLTMGGKIQENITSDRKA